MNEFNIIEKYFKQQNTRTDIRVSVGDDCALINVPEKHTLAITMDTLISGTHFLPETSAYDIGYKSLAVSLSDLAAMGASPAWITGALTLPHDDQTWLSEFSRGLFDLANQYNVALIGGDLTKGPLSITIQAAGYLPQNNALLRSGANPGDIIYVTHSIGDAAIGLDLLLNQKTIDTNEKKFLVRKLQNPEPRIEIGKQLLNIATACIDISDGLVADLSHILNQSKVGATIIVDDIPFSEEAISLLPFEKRLAFALNGGDDYELCFTVPPEKTQLIHFNCRAIGTITKEQNLNLIYKNGAPYRGTTSGYLHFNGES